MLRPSLEIAAALFVVFIALPQDTATNPQRKAEPAHVKIATIPARPEDVSSIDGMVKAYYDVVSGPAGQPRQWDRDHTLYIPEMRFIQFSESKDGKVTAQSMTHQQFVDSSQAGLGTNAFYEHEIHRITHRFGNTAHVLCTAEQTTAPNGPVIGHSIDSLELFYDGHRWWITSAGIWPADRPNRPLTPEFLPAAH
jgi:hypothetical protein